MSERIGPFAGIACDRPYPVSGLNTQLWEDTVPVQYVEFGELTLTQDGVYFAKLFGSQRAVDRFPHVVAYEGRKFLEDGHHRVLRAVLQGADGMLMRVFRSNSESG